MIVRLWRTTLMKVEQKKKGLMFIGDVELVNLDDYKVLDKRLQCDNNNTDDKDIMNPEGMDVDNGAASCLQNWELDMGTQQSRCLLQWQSLVSLLERQVLLLWTCFSMQLERPLIQML
jgi:hypothetical protein